MTVIWRWYDDPIEETVAVTANTPATVEFENIGYYNMDSCKLIFEPAEDAQAVRTEASCDLGKDLVDVRVNAYTEEADGFVEARVIINGTDATRLNLFPGDEVTVVLRRM